MKDYSSSRGEALEARIEFLQFMALLHISKQALAPTFRADLFWHVFLLHTREYMRFCTEHFGKFIHHEPLDEESSEDDALSASTQSLWDATFTRLSSQGSDWCLSAMCFGE